MFGVPIASHAGRRSSGPPTRAARCSRYLVLIQLLASSTRGGQFLSSMIVFPLMMIGGSFFPLEVMPPWMARIGRWTPNGLGVVQLKEILFGASRSGDGSRSRRSASACRPSLAFC